MRTLGDKVTDILAIVGSTCDGLLLMELSEEELEQVAAMPSSSASAEGGEFSYVNDRAKRILARRKRRRDAR